MDAFERNKFNEESFIKYVLGNSMIVSYGFISSIDFDTVTVTTLVSDKKYADKITCVFMNLGNDQFSIALEPAVNMRVVVLSPNKGAVGMYETEAQITKEQGRNFISASAPAVYSSQFCFCIPLLRSTVQSLSSLIINNDALIGEIKHEMIMTLFEAMELDIMGDSNIELHEGTKHFRGCYGDMEQTFGMVEGTNGTEKPGTYVYKEIYGKFSSVEKNYESGLKVTVGKAYEKPFLENKGNLVDASAPVTLELGTAAPVNGNFGAPVTLIFGESVMTITADAENGLDISLTGNTKVNITAATGKFSIKNSTGSLKDVLDKVADLFTNMTTIGPNVVPAVPYTAAATPATVALATELKTLVASLLE